MISSGPKPGYVRVQNGARCEGETPSRQPAGRRRYVQLGALKPWHA
jgi:hypothetical protein